MTKAQILYYMNYYSDEDIVKHIAHELYHAFQYIDSETI